MEGERDGERDGGDGAGQDESEGEDVVVRDQDEDRNQDLGREKARRVRLLDVKTEALAEFMREEFEGFRMPKVDL